MVRDRKGWAHRRGNPGETGGRGHRSTNPEMDEHLMQNEISYSTKTGEKTLHTVSDF